MQYKAYLNMIKFILVKDMIRKDNPPIPYGIGGFLYTFIKFLFEYFCKCRKIILIKYIRE